MPIEAFGLAVSSLWWGRTTVPARGIGVEKGTRITLILECDGDSGTRRCAFIFRQGDDRDF